MNAFDKVKLVLSAIALLAFGSSQNHILGVEGAIAVEVGVVCHPDVASLCYRKKTYWSPSPAILCEDPSNEETCEQTYQGGWGWKYIFRKGLQEGTEDPEVIQQADAYMSIVVTIEDDKTTCNIKISEDDCEFCSAGGCEFGHVKYDCTNLVSKGKASLEECEPVDDPFLFPLLLKPEKPSDNDTTAENYAEHSSSESRYALWNCPTIVLGFAGTLWLLFAYLQLV